MGSLGKACVLQVLSCEMLGTPPRVPAGMSHNRNHLHTCHPP